MTAAHRNARYRASHREQRAAYARAWRKKNAEARAEYGRRWRRANRAVMCTIARRYRERNRMAIKVARGLGIPIPEARALIRRLEATDKVPNL